MENLKDHLTGINNEFYLKLHYQEYISTHKDAQFIMIDFEKFKNINDVFGHNMGDQYLIVFASIIKNVFQDSLVVRLHGDEFAILTEYNPEEIEKLFLLCDKMIQLSVVEGKIPAPFHFNAGSTKAEHGIQNTKEKADYMMYYAKKNKKRYQEFKEDIWNIKNEEDLFLNKIDSHLKNDHFQYSIRQMFYLDKNKTNIYQIYTKDMNGFSLFEGRNYEILQKNKKLEKLDIHNIKYLLDSINTTNQQNIININYLTILSSEQLYEYLIVLKSLSKINFENIILSINLKEISFDQYFKLIQKIEILKDMGFKIILAQYNSKIGDEIWENAEIDYIKFDQNYWNKAMICDKVDYSLRKKVDMIMGAKSPTIPIFDLIEKEEQHQYIESFKNKDILVSGNYYSTEKKLNLTK